MQKDCLENPAGPGGYGAPRGELRESERVCMYVCKLACEKHCVVAPQHSCRDGGETVQRLWSFEWGRSGSKLALALTNYVTCPLEPVCRLQRR